MRRQIGSVTGNVSLLTAGSIVLGDFSTPLRFARNDVAREVSTVRYPLSAYREGKDGFENWNLGSVVPPLAGGQVVRSTKGRWLRHQTVRLQTVRRH